MSLLVRHACLVRLALRSGLVAVLLMSFAAPTRAQEQSPQQPQPAPPAAPTSSPSSPAPAGSTPDAGAPPAPSKPAESPADSAGSKDRIFGVLPNYTTVEGTTKVAPITTGQSFKMAALDSFDPFVYPLFGFIAVVSHVQNQEPSWGRGWHGYSRRYGAAFADNTVCSLITTGLMPSLLKQDPRYFQGGATGFFHRVAYAASRSAITHSRTGQRQFNLSEIGGTLVVANISNLYYPPDERTTHDTLVRWGTQAMWDTVANELKEFWPDIRGMLHGH